MKKTEFYALVAIVLAAVVSFPNLGVLHFQSLVSGICIGAATLLFYANVRRPLLLKDSPPATGNGKEQEGEQ